MAKNPFAKRALVSPLTRQPIVPQRGKGLGAGLNAEAQPKAPAVAVRNLLQRQRG